MILAAIAPWFGGKRTMAPLIVEQLGKHKSYYEPFCGSCAVLFAKPHSSIEIVNDLHGDLVNLARALASDDWRDLYEKVDRMLICQEWIDDLREQFATDFDQPQPDVQRASEYMALSWMTRNGVGGTSRTNYQMCLRWTPNGGSPGIRWRSAVDSVPYWHDRLKGVVITRQDALGLIPKIDDAAGTALYVDPPYLRTTRGGGGGGSAYKYDFTDDGGRSGEGLFSPGDDHARLAELLQRFKKARVVVSYYDHPRLTDLYPGWTKIDCARQKNLHVQNRRGIGYCEAPEVLLVNGEEFK